MDLGTSSHLMENSGWAMSLSTISPHRVCVPVPVIVCVCVSHYGMVAPVIPCLLGNYDLRIDMEDFEGNQRFAEYKNFRVDDEKVKHGRCRTIQVVKVESCHFLSRILDD